MALIGPPELKVTPHRPVEVAGMYGILRTVREIRLRVDGTFRLHDLPRTAVEARRPGVAAPEP